MLYLFISSIFAISSFAQSSPILTLDQFSGYGPPQYAMEAHCVLDSSHHVVAKILRDFTNDTWQSESNIDHVITEADFNQVQTWINEAAEGPFKQGTTPCDIGTMKMVTQNYPLIISQGCGKRVLNSHPSATKLITWFRQACSLDGTKQ